MNEHLIIPLKKLHYCIIFNILARLELQSDFIGEHLVISFSLGTHSSLSIA